MKKMITHEDREPATDKDVALAAARAVDAARVEARDAAYEAWAAALEAAWDAEVAWVAARKAARDAKAAFDAAMDEKEGEK